MHKVFLPHDLNLGQNGLFEAGEYLMEDRNAAEVMLGHPDAGISMERFDEKDHGLTQIRRVLVAGGIGMGDAIMLTPVLRALKKKFPDASLEVACFAHFRQALLNLPYIDGFATWPMKADAIHDYQRVYFIENFQYHTRAKTLHLTDVFAEICDIELGDDKQADYKPTPDEVKWAIATFPRVTGRKRIGMQVQASERCRTYPAKLLRDLMRLLIRDGWEVYLMGAPGEFECMEQGYLHDLCKVAPTFRESATFLTTCDAFVGPDSGFIHVAGAMGIPSVGVFSVFPWQLRTAYYPSVKVISGIGECSPCFYSPSKLQPPLPVNGPCFITGKCSVLESIEPIKIASKINKLYNENGATKAR